MRRMLATLTTAVLIMTLPATHATAGGLKDMQGHWARAQVEAGVTAGYVSGYPDGTFRPQASVTRAEFFKLLSGAMRIAPSAIVTGFREQGTDHWAFSQGYLSGAVSAGLIYPPDYGEAFGPDLPIRRREIVLAAVRALGLEGEASQYAAPLQTPDADQYPVWLQRFATLAMRERILTGYEDRSLGLEKTATRAEALVMVQRILDKVQMELVAAGAPALPPAVRHPAEGEPLWIWSDTGESGADPTERVTEKATAGSRTYDLPDGAKQVQLLPAPGKMAWVHYQVGAAAAVARLQDGKLAEVARFEERNPDLLTVDDAGRLWFTDGAGQLLVVGRTGQARTIAGVADRLRFGAIDWDGRFWGLGQSRLYRVSPEGAITMMETDLPADRQVQQMEMADDGSIWVILPGSRQAGTAKAEAIQLREGRSVQRVELLSPYFGGLGVQARLGSVGRSGPFVWLGAKIGTASPDRFDAGLYRLNLITGAFSRMVPPPGVGANLVPQRAPEGGLLLKGAEGKFWRVLP